MQIQVVQEFLVRFEDRSLVGIGLLQQFRPKRLELVLCLRNRSFELPLLLAWIRTVLNHRNLLAPKLEDLTDSQAGRGGHTMQTIWIVRVRSLHWCLRLRCSTNRSGSRDFFV